MSVYLLDGDSLVNNLQSKSRDFFNISNVLDVGIQLGRPVFVVSLMYRLVFLINSFIYYKIITLGSIVLNFILFSFFVKSFFESKKLFYLSLLLSIVFIQNAWHPIGLMFYMGIMPMMLNLLLAAFLFFIGYIQNGNKRYLLLSLIFYSLTLFSYEVFILYFPVFYLIVLKKKGGGFLNSLKWIIPFIVLLLIYFPIVLYLRNNTSSLYPGVTVDKYVDLWVSLKTIWQFSIASIPTYMFFNDSWARALGVFQGHRISSVQLIWVIKSVIILFCLRHIVKIKDLCWRGFGELVPVLIVMAYFFIPSSLNSLTSHYKHVAMDKIFLGIAVSYLSYFSFILLISLLMVILLSAIQKKFLRLFLITLASFIIVVVAFITDFSNLKYSISQTRAYQKWEIFDKFAKTNNFQNIPEGSIVYAPGLFYYTGTLDPGFDTYWTDYVKSNFNKSVDIRKNIPIEEISDMYYINLTQSIDKFCEYIVFSKISKVVTLDKDMYNLISDSASVYGYPKNINYNIVGKMQKNINSIDSLSIKSDSGVFDETMDFAKKVGLNDYKMDEGLKRTDLILSDGFEWIILDTIRVTSDL